ncbi:MAG: hypothetical protein JO295_03565 [Verrucomicrobia bacterium]|nr:hypothetical protein [Verrucomicrobiota bacterium]
MHNLLPVSEKAVDAALQHLRGAIDLNAFPRGNELQKDPQHKKTEEKAKVFSVGILAVENQHERERQKRQAEKRGDEQQQKRHLPNHHARRSRRAADEIHGQWKYLSS